MTTGLFPVYNTAMKIKEAAIEYEDKLPYGARLCRISHARPHYHAKDLELVFCLEGAVELVAGHQKVRLQAGDVFPLTAGTFTICPLTQKT